YFHNKHDLLLSMFQAAAQGGMDRVAAAKSRGGSVVDCLEALLPMTEESRRDWRGVLAFLGHGTSDQAFRKGQRLRARETYGLVVEQLERLHPANPAQVEFHARTIISLLNGLATHAVFSPREWTATHIRRVLRGAVEAVATDGKK